MSGCTCTSPVLLDLACPVHGDDVSALVVDAIDHDRIIQEQPPGRCDLCGAVAETRPYGPNGENVCFPCGMKDEAAMKRAFQARLDGNS